MKKHLIFTGILCALIAVSCKKSNTVNPNAAIVEAGKWKISSFINDNVNSTANFSDYDFSFNANGVASAVSSAATVNGTWSLSNDDSKDKFILNFTSPSSFESLSEDWTIIVLNDVSIQLKHTSGGNNLTDTLTFLKK